MDEAEKEVNLAMGRNNRCALKQKQNSGTTHKKFIKGQLQADGKVKDEAKTSRAKTDETFFGHRECLVQISVIRHSGSPVQVENISDLEHHRQDSCNRHNPDNDKGDEDGREDTRHLSFAGYVRSSIGDEHR